MLAIVSNLRKKNLIFVKTPKMNFLDPQTTNLNKTRRGHFRSSGPQKTHTKLYPCLDISLFSPVFLRLLDIHGTVLIAIKLVVLSFDRT